MHSRTHALDLQLRIETRVNMTFASTTWVSSHRMGALRTAWKYTCHKTSITQISAPSIHITFGLDKNMFPHAHLPKRKCQSNNNVHATETNVNTHDVQPCCCHSTTTQTAHGEQLGMRQYVHAKRPRLYTNPSKPWATNMRPTEKQHHSFCFANSRHSYHRNE